MEALATHAVTEGYVATSSPVAQRTNSLASGSKNLIVTGHGRSVAHAGVNPLASVAGSRALFNLPNGSYAGLGTAATNGIGSIVGLIARAFAFIGQGALYIAGVSRAVNASTALQILLFRASVYTGAGTGPYVAGLEQATAPTIAEHSVNASTTNSGTTSTVHWFVRSATGGRGRKSAPSNVLVVNGKTVRHTVAGADLTTASTLGYDRLGIGVTQWGFGSTGPHYEEREIAISSLTTVDGVANSVELQWSSAGLSGAALAPIDDYQPPAAVFAAALEDAVAVIGAYGDSTSGVSATSPGTAIAVSLPVFIESYPPDSLLFLPGAPVGVLPRASAGFAFIWGKDYLCALTYTGGTPPMSLQTVWANTGIASPNAAFLGEGGRLYCFTSGKRGIARLGEKGEPDTEFASDIADYVADWNPANVIGGWDNNYQLAIFGHDKTLVAFNSQVGRWCAPIDITGALGPNETLAACVTVDGTLYLAVRNTVSTGDAMRLLTFDGGTGTTYEYVSPWARSAAHADEVFQVDALIRADNVTYPVEVNVYTNGDLTTPKKTKSYTLAATGKQYLSPPVRCDVRGARFHCVKISQRSEGGDSGVDAVEVRGARSAVVT